jgi:hypothetical protein
MYEDIFARIDNTSGGIGAVNPYKTSFDKIEGRQPLQPVNPLREAQSPEANRSAMTVGFQRSVSDPLISAVKGAIGLPEAAVGIADIATGGAAGRIAERIGFKPKEAKEILDRYLSPEQIEADRRVQEAEGFGETLRTAIKNPSTIIHSVIESAPSMIGGGAAARGLLRVAPKIGAVTAGAAGEGLVSAGQTAEEIRQESDAGSLTAKQAAISAGSGALTGMFAVMGGKLAQRLGIADVDTLLAGGSLAAPVNTGAKKGVLRKVIESALQEGAFEELPQSAQEQIAHNMALGKPRDEGVANAAATGMLAGAVMGAAGGGYSHLAGKKEKTEKKSAARSELLKDQPIERSKMTAREILKGDVSQNPVATKIIKNAEEVAEKEATGIDVQSEEDLTPETIAKLDQTIAKETEKTREEQEPVVERRGKTDRSAFIRQYVDVQSAKQRMQGMNPDTVALVHEAEKEWEKAERKESGQAAVKTSPLEEDTGVHGTSETERGVKPLQKDTMIGGSKEIGALYDYATSDKTNRKRAVRYHDVTPDEARLLKEKTGLELDGYSHTVDSFGIRHAMRQHGNAEKESKRGQIAISSEDIKMAPEIVKNYDSVEHAGTTGKGEDVIKYSKKVNGFIYYVEEVRTGRKELTMQSLWKIRNASNALPEGSPSLTSENVHSESPQRIVDIIPKGASEVKSKAAGTSGILPEAKKTEGKEELVTEKPTGAGEIVAPGASSEATEETQAGKRIVDVPKGYYIDGSTRGGVVTQNRKERISSVRNENGKWVLQRIPYNSKGMPTWPKYSAYEYDSPLEAAQALKNKEVTFSKEFASQSEARTPATQQTETEVKGDLKAGTSTLPANLSGAKPRYSYGNKKFTLKFDSDVDRAAYITAQEKKSKLDDKFVDFVKKASGLSEAEVRAHGKAVKDTIKSLAKDADAGELTVKAHEAGKKVEAKAKAPIKVKTFKEKKTSPRKGAEGVIGRINELGGLKTGKDYRAKELRQYPDLKRVLNNKKGMGSDDLALILNDEGYDVGSGDDLVELLKTGQARDILTPSKAERILEKKLKEQQDEWAREQLAKLEEEGIDAGRIETSSGDLSSIAQEALRSEGTDIHNEEAVLKELDDFFSEVAAKPTDKKPATETQTELPGTTYEENFALAPSKGEHGGKLATASQDNAKLFDEPVTFEGVAIHKGRPGYRLDKDMGAGVKSTHGNLRTREQQSLFPETETKTEEGGTVPDAGRGVDNALILPEIVSEKEGTIAVPRKVSSISDVAQIGAAYLGKYPQERFLTIAIDNAGKVVYANLHSTGGMSSTNIDPSIVVGNVLGNPDAKKVWFVHNHPSQQTGMSDADVHITRALSNLLRGTRLNMGGSIVVSAKGDYSGYNADGSQISGNVAQLGKSKSKKTGLTVRIFKTFPNQKTISSPEDFIHFVKQSGIESGVVLTDTKNQPSGLVTGIKDYSRLRGANQERLLEAIDKANANAIMVYEPERTLTGAELKNITDFASAINGRLIDVVDATGSRAEKDTLPKTSDSTEFYSVSKKGEATKAPLTLEAVKSIFPKQQVIQNGDNFYVTLKNGAKATIYGVDYINPNTINLKVGYKKEALEKGEIIAGAFGLDKNGRGIIQVVRTREKAPWTITHESVHWLERLGVITELDKVTLNARIRKDGKWNKNLSPKENRANWLADFSRGPKPKQTVLAQIWQKIQDFIARIAGIRTADMIGRELQSGKIFERDNEKRSRRHVGDYLDKQYSIASKIADVRDAINSIAAGAEESTVKGLRPDLVEYGGTPDVTFIYGDKKKGLYHIGNKRGAGIVHEVIATVINGKISRYTPRNKTVVLSKGNYEAVLSLDEHGNKKTWLLTGWAKEKPDATGEVSAQSGATQARPTFSRSDLVAGFGNSLKPFDDLVKKNEQNEEYSIQSTSVESKSLFPEVQERIKAAKGIKHASMKDKAKDLLALGWTEITRHFPHLDPKTQGKTIEVLRQFQEVPVWSKRKATDKLDEFIGKLSPDDRNVFGMNLILADMLRDLDSELLSPHPEEGLPFGYKDRDQVQQDYDHFADTAGKRPEIKEALKKRNEYMREINERMIDLKILPKSLANDPSSYFHHQVLAYLNYQSENKGLGVSAKEVKVRKKGWQFSRQGSVKDYNTEYVEAEFEVLSQALAQIKTVETINEIDRLENIKGKLERRAKAENMAAFWSHFNAFDDPLKPYRVRMAFGFSQLEKFTEMGEIYYPDEFGDLEDHIRSIAENKKDVDDPKELYAPHPKMFAFLSYLVNHEGVGAMPAATIFKAIADRNKFIRETVGEKNWKTYRDMIPEGYVSYKPDAHPAFYFANSIQDQVLEKVLSGSRDLMSKDVRAVLAKARDAEWVVPEGVALTLKEFRPETEKSLVGKLSGNTLSMWKQWVLINPYRVFRYNLNNMSGDTDICMAYELKIITQYAMQAFKDLKAAHKGLPPGKLKDEIDIATQKGVIGSGMTQWEIPELSDVQSVKGLVDFFDGKSRNALTKTWEFSKSWTTLRENILRLAAYRYFKDQLAAGRKDIYAASNKIEIDQIVDMDDRAAKLSRELVGDYGNISHAGQYIRKRLIPFYSWCVPEDTEILTREGWKKHSELQIGEEVMSYSMEKRETEWQALLDCVSFDVDEDLVTLSNVQGKHQFRFTKEHRVPVIEQYKDKRKMVLAKDLKQHHKIPLVAPHRFEEGSILSPIDAALLGWLVTDGYFRIRSYSPQSFEAMLYQKKPEMVKEIRSRFADYITSESVHPTTETICFRLRAKSLRKIRKVFTSKDDLPGIVTRLNKESCEAMFQAMMMAEGSVVEHKNFAAFPQNDGPVIDAFQILCYRLGMAGHIRDKNSNGVSQKSLYIKRRDRISIHKWAIGNERYVGKVWCPKTANGTWVMRQNGKVMITGNCEINAPRYVRLLRNVKHEGGGYGGMASVAAWKAAKLGLKAMTLMGMVMLWNAAFFADEEDELQETGREQLHLILGRRKDGSIITLRFQGALSDALQWFGLENPLETARLVASGRKSGGDLAKDSSTAGVLKLFQGLRPEPKLLYEVAAGQSFFPSPARPRPIRDTTEHILRTFSLDKPYKLLAGKPRQDGSIYEQLKKDIAGILVHYADPGEQAYYTARKYVYDWLDDQGKEKPTITPTNKSNALYYYKQALKYSDFEAAERYLKKYKELGGKEHNIGASIKRAAPIASLKLSDRYKFKQSLSPEQRETLRIATEWYKKHYVDTRREQRAGAR